MKQRQRNIYNGFVYLNNGKKLLLDGETIIRWGGYRIGDAGNIPYKQKIQNPKIDTILLKDRIKLNYKLLEFVENSTDITS
jgi:hypothetical protein